MKQRLVQWIVCIALTLMALGLPLLPTAYEHYVTAELAKALDLRHGKSGWAVLWMSADRQPSQSMSLYRTLYVKTLFPRLQRFTPWKKLHFTNRNPTPNRPWHYAVCVISEGREVTYFWSIAKHKWISVWDNNTHQFPRDVQRDYARRLVRVNRERGLNWSIDEKNKI